MPRKYTKRSDYWEKRKNKSKSIESIASANDSDFKPLLVGDSIYESVGSRLTQDATERSRGRKNTITSSPTSDRFKNIADGLLPFHYSRDSVDVSDTIELCQKAYFNVPAFKSTIDLLSSFADSDIYLEGGNEKSRKFVKAWLKRINIHNLKSQFFLEYYRSGNVFLYRLEGKMKASQRGKLLEAYGATNGSTKIPIRYILINPTDIIPGDSLAFTDCQYFKSLTAFEIARLKDPQTDHEKEMYEALPEAVKLQLRTASAISKERIHIPLDPSILHILFYKKQDYEPMAIPPGFCVLDDINKKIELKKIDQAIARSIENVVLLVTMGAKPDEGGINPKAIAAMQNIFQNQSVGRVLVSDYTTKAEFVIPDLKKVMGSEKYEILNRDIQEGLQNVLIGDTKYSDGTLKMKIFIQKLEEARVSFIRDFLQPEITRICKAMGMRSWPKAELVKTDTLDNADMTKLATRLMELGIITPEQGMKTIETGAFPKAEDMQEAQKTFKAQREEGHYLPLVNSINMYEGEGGEGEPQESPTPISQPSDQDSQVKTAREGKQNAPKGQAPSGGRPMGSSNAELFSKADIIKTTKEITEFEHTAFAEFALKYGVDSLDDKRKEVVSDVCATIVAANPKEKWNDVLADAVEDYTILANMKPTQEIIDIAAKHQLDDFSAAILHHSTKIACNEE